MKNNLFKLLVATVLLGFVAYGCLTLYSNHQRSKLPDLSFSEALAYTTKDNPDAIITVGILKDGHTAYTVYGENAQVLPKEQHSYEIGSITKTFTATMIRKAERDGLIDRNDAINHYPPLPQNKTYPTLEALLTHTSGYKNYYFDRPMVANFLTGRNSFYGIHKERIGHKIATLNMTEKEYPFVYSNFGYAVLGLVLESVYKKDYTTLMNDFVQNDLGLHHTKLSDSHGDLQNYWAWQKDDGYMPAGAMTSTIDDMLAYAAMQLKNDNLCSDCQRELKAMSNTPKEYSDIDIHTDAIAYSWLIDKRNHIIWHNGGTGHFNCYVGFDTQSQTAVVVLSNVSPHKRIPATILGIKLMNELRA